MGYHQQSSSTLMLLVSPNTMAGISTLHLHSLPQTTSKYMKRKPQNLFHTEEISEITESTAHLHLQKEKAQRHPKVW